MHSILSRHPSATGSSHRAPRKSTSFLSLRREKDRPAKDKSPSPPDPYLDSHDSSANFDSYHKSHSSSRSSKSKPRRPSPSRTPPLGNSATAKEADAYAFPSFDSADDVSTPTTIRPSQNPYSRTRSTTGPSGRSEWDDLSAVPPLRFSGSSSTQHETPPRTPIDYTDSVESFEHFPVVVAAPISGVETMDALVDGMNGGDILGGSLSLSNRARFGVPGHHPLYQPPLPTPPPGVVLGGGKPRRRKLSSSDSGDDDDIPRNAPPARPRRSKVRPSPARSASASTIIASPPTPEATPSPPSSFTRPADKAARQPADTPVLDRRKSVVPSISEIIRAHAPPDSQVRSRPSTARSSSIYTHSQGHGTVHEEQESEPEPVTREEEAELMSRSSIDSVADEIQQTLRNQGISQRVASAPPSSFLNRHSVISDNASVCSPRSDPGRTSSIYSSSAASIRHPSSPLDTNFLALTKPSPSQAVAQYLRSARLTTLLRLTRSPHASQDNPLTVSLSDLGSSTGFPVVIFLGLGCVRHIMGLYDEMAACMGLRLITIDRWGLGRTDSRSKSARGIVQWASVVEEVLDLLHIDQCSIMAHSAGAPYALSFANRLPSRIRGDICLLAPWVGGGESSGYKWLKYVPNGILKTAQAAEWKLQAWMIGKPPTIAYEGIGYTAPAAPKHTASPDSSPPRSNASLAAVYPSNGEGRPRPSFGSSTFSEYDDLGDFEGRFESRSTLGVGVRSPPPMRRSGSETKIFVNKRKTSRGFLERLKGTSTSPDPQVESKPETKPTPGKGLKALRSMGSLKGKNRVSRSSEPPSPQMPPSLRLDIGGFEDLGWTRSIDSDSFSGHVDPFAAITPKASTSNYGPRSYGRRSISFTSPKTSVSMPSSPTPSPVGVQFVPEAGSNSYQAALGNALIAASHAESAKGTHSDLLQILNHENHSWGFSYSSYPHKVRVWYGDKDEKIAENAVRWMERTMDSNKCIVKVVKGADHGLMYRSGVVVDVLERILAAWRPGEQPY